MANICQITGKKVITGNNVSHSKRRTRRRFYPNLMDKKFYLPEEDRFVELKVSTKGLKMINKKGLKSCLDEAVSKGYLKSY
jgi:large subunit ribosomal protein L28